MIVWLASYQRSGNTFTRMIIYNAYGYETYSAHGEFNFTDISPYIGHKTISKINLMEMQESTEIFFVKTHHYPGVIKTGGSPAIYIIRDGRDVMISSAHHFITNRPKLKDISVDKVISNFIKSSDWASHIKAWEKYSPKVIIKYEDLKNDSIETVDRALKNLSINIPKLKDIRIPTFEELHKVRPDFFRRGKIGSWKDEMSIDNINLFNKYYSKLMVDLGY